MDIINLITLFISVRKGRGEEGRDRGVKEDIMDIINLITLTFIRKGRGEEVER